MTPADHPTAALGDPQLLVIFGATGDLARRNLFPGLFRLHLAGLLPDDFRVIGSGRHSPGTDEEFRDDLGAAVRTHAGEIYDEARWNAFARHIGFVVSSADDAAELATAVRHAQREAGDRCRTLLYLSVPPSIAEAMVRMLGDSGIAEGASLIMEKPFGRDLASARSLDATIAGIVPEERVFRIDHFLGLEAVRGLLALRFAGGVLAPLWNRDHIASVQIDVPEEIGLEGRAGFMESTGTFRDMVSTHLCQLLGIVAIEPPARIAADELRAEKLKVYRALRPFDPAETVFGQFEGYRDEDGVADDSRVETFVALRAWVDNWRWQGVPFLLRTGKALGGSRWTVTIAFREPPLTLFERAPEDPDRPTDADRPDELSLELSDTPTATLYVRAKAPGAELRVGRAAFTLRLDDAFPDAEPLEAYEKLLLDALRGDQTLFTGSAEIERLWEVCDPVLRDPPEPLPYPAGSWGPPAALELPGPPGWAVPGR
ncbi:glucose-6-phosphate dehydrogenase [Streptomyces sp. NBRC 109706]|uniref:glucose-6-phosphate dehydrogenase n=1 Tax=Streptomyces sp. NBRC 109706 TaxID=1550035 RepID=UPI0007841024|nr:glucose-6-phosphate dehydrogenase [Streptomyces sp. NBRC 109706]